ncbi:MAG: preprotein translocase subunit SecA [Saprospiraceae bacterium]
MFKSITAGLKKMFGTKYERDVATYQPVVEQINEIFQGLSELSNDALRNKTLDFRTRIATYLQDIDAEIASLQTEAEGTEDVMDKESIFATIDKLAKQRNEELEIILKEILPEAFAVMKETARRFTENDTLRVTATDHDRALAATGKKGYVTIEGEQALWKNQWVAAGGNITWNMVHYDVQLIGGMVLHDGKIAEMQTGEGKTLVATLPAYLNGLAGQGVHVVTVNDYLARRDSEWIGPVMEFLFLTIDCIDKYQPHSPQRKAAYDCDITYGTNNEFGFDYLRDNMVRTKTDQVQIRHHYAMVDEVDSVLIDAARTPWIMSGPVGHDSEDQEYLSLKPFVERLITEQRRLAADFLVEAKKAIKDGNLGNNEGQAGLALLRAYRALPKSRPLIKFLSEEGVKVNLQKAENFYMQEQSKHMHIADEPLLFTIDEKNRSVELTERGIDYLSKGKEDPSFFIMPDIATEMVNIDRNGELDELAKADAKNKLAQDYSVKAKRIHSMNQLLKAYTLFEREEDYVVMDGQVKIVDEQTGRMMEGRRYSDGLHQALEAKENVKVGEVTQTYATITLQNYFRMYHKLAGMTGTAETEASELWEIYKLDVVVIPTNRPVVRDDKDDLVFKTEREKFNAVIEEIVTLSQAGRPILVGTTTVDISEKLSRLLSMRGIDHNVLNAKQHQREAEIVAEAGQPGKVTIATNMAGRGTDIKINDQVKAAGGLAIIGTERHDSRRVDRQLRGRSGRQGDPGSSQFYISLEDKLMRLFQSERIAKLMDSMGHKEGEVIQHSMVTKSIERAQKKVEENAFGVRKRLLEYDDVMNIQREAIYRKRENALAGDRLAVDLNSMFMGLIEEVVYNHKQNGDFSTFEQACLSKLGLDPDIDPDAFKTTASESIIETVAQQFRDFYHHKYEQIVAMIMPQIKHVFETQSDRYKRILLPFTDGSTHPLNITADLETAVKTNGKSVVRDIEQAVALAIIDEKWKNHLRSMDELKESSQAASFEQKDPLVVYKMEAYNLFEGLIMEVNESVTSYLAKGGLAINQNVQQAREERPALKGTTTNKAADEGERMQRAAAENVGRSASQAKPETFKRDLPKVGRNDDCPCGSGKKYKHCHGR